MHAAPGDWLVVKSSRDTVHARHALILTVSDGGDPPFHIKWIDTGRESLIYPGPDAVVITAEEQAEYDRQQTERAQHVQADIEARLHRSTSSV